MRDWNFGRIILFPLAVIYDGITRFRNHLFQIGHKPSFEFETVVISVGNLSVGGTGKTPMIEYLIRLLKNSRNIATLSRGYGRRSRGFRIASTVDTAASMGDEPFQFFLKFKDRIHVAVGEDRALAIPSILHQFPETDVILLDDAFQHRTVRPQLSILLTEFANPFYDDFVLPAGRLREARRGAERADIIVITKCPELLEENDIKRVFHNVQSYAGNKPTYFSAIKYAQPIGFGKAGGEVAKSVLLVSGIANSAALEKHVKSKYTLIKHVQFPDHHSYSTADLSNILNLQKQMGEDVAILTTEKDMSKIIDESFKEYRLAAAWYYLPIEFCFIKDGEKFDDQVLQMAERNR